ncbi:MAG: universal stress protein [Bacteroidota bacterium]
MKTILCLTDYTPSSKIAWGMAQQFSERLNYRIVLAHIEPTDHFEYKAESLDKLHQFSRENRISRSEKEDEIMIELAFGNIVEQCEWLAKKYDPSLLVIGKRKKKMLEGIFWGESTQKIIDRLDFPVIVIPEEASEAPLSSIYYATDFSSGSISTLDVLLPWCTILGIKLHLLHVSETEDDEYKAITKMNQILHSFAEDNEELGMDFKILNGEPFSAILAFLNENPAVMLAVTFHERSFWERLVEHSLVQEMTAAIKNPMLVFKH